MIGLAAYVQDLAARAWYRPAGSRPFTYQEAAIFEELEPAFTSGDAVRDESGGVWVIASLDMASGCYRVRPKAAVAGFPESGFSPFTFAQRAMWAGEPTWLATEYALSRMEREPW